MTTGSSLMSNHIGSRAILMLLMVLGVLDASTTGHRTLDYNKRAFLRDNPVPSILEDKPVLMGVLT